ncbi:MAG TPA: hypothetical protein VFV67_29880 [Actinophytocola sp.]|uniref:hypothetical protein n=1 Tax=Actinophytocola sp. TaxID=1872138 RepID=UPI002DC0284E|nr:hypothetical protein [Actinophytocola sp.]HEU5474874.1 hypothetical protein [Actinophytocola sp.]
MVERGAVTVDGVATPEAARRRARYLLVGLASLALMLIILAGRMAPLDDQPSVATAVSLIIAWPLLWILPITSLGWRARVDGADNRYVTAHTMSGRRTVDLHRLERIRRFQLMSRTKTMDCVVLRDADGIRLMIDDPEVREALRTAISDGLIDSARTSRPAQARLGLITASLPQRVWWATTYFLGYLAYAGLTAVGSLTVLILISEL